MQQVLNKAASVLHHLKVFSLRNCGLFRVEACAVALFAQYSSSIEEGREVYDWLLVQVQDCSK